MYCFAIGTYNMAAYKIGHKLVEALYDCCLTSGYACCMVNDLNQLPKETDVLIFIPESFNPKDITKRHSSISYVQLSYDPLPHLDEGNHAQGTKRDWNFYKDMCTYKGVVDFILHPSKASTRFLNSRGHRAFHLPMGYHRFFSKGPQCKKTILVSHQGHPSPRRQLFLRYLKSKGVDVTEQKDWTDFQSYLDMMAASQMTLNIGMQNEERFFPSCRVVLFAFSNKTLVLTEKCVEPDGCRDEVHFVTFNGRKDLLSKVKFYSTHVQAREDLVNTAYDYAVNNSLKSSLKRCLDQIKGHKC